MLVLVIGEIQLLVVLGLRALLSCLPIQQLCPVSQGCHMPWLVAPPISKPATAATLILSLESPLLFPPAHLFITLARKRFLCSRSH